MYPSKLAPYLPDLLLDWYRTASPGKVHNSSHHAGCLMCVDISGFTSLNRELSQRSNSGSEQVAGIVNRVLSEMRSQAAVESGQILKFAGDAAWLYFPDRIDTAAFFSHLVERIQAVNRGFDILQQTPISIHAGAGYGAFELVTVGQGQRLEMELCGKLVRDVYAACDRATQGRLAEVPEDESAEDTVKSTSTSTFGGPLPSVESLQRYLPIEILRRLEGHTRQQRIVGEIRDVVALFVLAEQGAGPVEGRKLQSLMSGLFKIIQSVGGSIARVDPYSGGHKLLVLFGAPNAGELDSLRAVQCARQLTQQGRSSLAVRCGVARGKLYCGEAGDAYRKEYTVIGEAVNLAARLMAAGSPGELLFDATLRRDLPKAVVSAEAIVNLKGFEHEHGVHRLVRIDEAIESNSAIDEPVGLDRERLLLRRSWRSLGRESHRHLVVTGAPGSGKSALLGEICADLGKRRARLITCKHALLFERGWLVRTVLHTLHHMHAVDDQESLEDYVERSADSRWLPLLSDALRREWPENEWTRNLSPDLRLRKTVRMVVSLVQSLCSKATLIAVDDVHRSDDYSLELLPLILSKLSDGHVHFMLATRESSFSTTDTRGLQSLALSYPERSEWWSWFERTFHQGATERQVFERMLVQSDGNPQFIREYVNELLRSGTAQHNEVNGRIEVVNVANMPPVPSSLRSLFLVQFDRLDDDLRSLLKVAAVAGGEFDLETLEASAPTWLRPHVRDKVLVLTQRHILRQTESNRYYFVSHAMAESIYECLPYSQRQELHEILARRFERSGMVEADILSHHFYHADRDSEALYYSLLAARQASDANSVLETAQMLARCREILSRSGDEVLHADQVAIFHRLQTDQLQRTGKMQEARQAARQWRLFARRTSRPADGIRAAVEMAHILSKQAHYQRTEHILQALLHSPAMADEAALYARALYILADTRRRQSRFEEARELCRQAISAAETVGEDDIRLRSQNNLGLVLWAEGKLPEAAEVYSAALADASEHGGMFSKAQTLNNLAIIHWEQGRFVQAEALMTEALTVFRSLGDRLNEAYSSGNLAALRKLAGRLVEARELFELADLVFKRNNDEHAHQYTVGNIGDLDLIEGNLESARRRFDEVHLFACRVQDQELEAECKVRLGELAFFEMSWDRAFRLLTEAAELAAAIGSTEYRLRALIGMARVHVGQSNAREAERLVSEIHRHASESRAILATREADFLAAECHRLRQDLEGACRLYSKTRGWASQERAFELQLKCLVRLIEFDHSGSLPYAPALQRLAASFIEANSRETWERLLRSPYLASFSATMHSVIPSPV